VAAKVAMFSQLPPGQSMLLPSLPKLADYTTPSLAMSPQFCLDGRLALVA